MMMKGLMMQQQQQEQVILDENMSNLSSASGEYQAVSVSSNSENRAQEIGSPYPPSHHHHQYFVHPPPTQSQPAVKKRRNLPGNPDPEAEVIALSPKTLMATNRFVCEICNKGFQRDQNLQLHRRGHNLPWKLKQRNKNEVVRKKVYVCPEVGCVHHDPSRALGDLTGIKKHFSRKHGEKKWKCDKCSKRYAVRSDWKAHSKTCGTREYRCDCGTLFSRRDSFITHRAFCDALAEESARTITGIPPAATGNQLAVQIPTLFNNAHLLDPIHSSFLKKEQLHFPPWLACPPHSSSAGHGDGSGPGPGPGPPLPMFKFNNSDTSTETDHQEFIQTQSQDHHQPPPPPASDHDHHSPSSTSTSHGGGGVGGPTLVAYPPTPAAHMSATALLQKAAQMGTTHLSSRGTSTTAPCTTTMRSHLHQNQQYQAHVSANPGTTAGAGNNNSGTSGSSGLHLSSRDHQEMMALASYGNKAAACVGGPSSHHQPLAFLDYHHNQIHNMNMNMSMMMNMNPADFVDGSTFQDAFSQILDAKKEQDHDQGRHHHGNFQESPPSSKTHHQLMMRHDTNYTTSVNGGNTGGGGGGNDGMTRDFLGLRALSHSDILSIATGGGIGLGSCGTATVNTTTAINPSASPEHPDQNLDSLKY